MKKTRRNPVRNNISSIFYTQEEYIKLMTNQLLCQSIVEELIIKLKNKSMIKDLKEYLNLDDTFEVELDSENIYIDFSITKINVEACVFLNMKILCGDKNIGKGEQLFFYIVNDKVDLDIV